MATVAPGCNVAPFADAPAPESSVTSPRLRPALVNGQRCWLECPPWCTEDHVAANERHLEDVCHTSGVADLVAPRLGGAPQLLLMTRLIAGDGGSERDRRSQVTVDVDDVNGMYLDPDEADVFAADLVAFAGQVRELARIARGN
jgi:hypothetical protein